MVQISRSRSRRGSPWMRKVCSPIRICSCGRGSGRSTTRTSIRVVSESSRADPNSVISSGRRAMMRMRVKRPSRSRCQASLERLGSEKTAQSAAAKALTPRSRSSGRDRWSRQRRSPQQALRRRSACCSSRSWWRPWLCCPSRSSHRWSKPARRPSRYQRCPSVGFQHQHQLQHHAWQGRRGCQRADRRPRRRHRARKGHGMTRLDIGFHGGILELGSRPR